MKGAGAFLVIVKLPGWSPVGSGDLDRRIPVKDTVMIGRESGSDLLIHRDSVSRRHAEIFFEDGHYWVRDLGSTTGSDLLIYRDTVSRRHAEIFFEDGHYWVRDLGSTNGTWRNDSPVGETAQCLEEGDLVYVDTTVLKFIRSEIEDSSNEVEDKYDRETQDPLTGIYNKGYLRSFVTREMVLSARKKTPMQGS